MALNDKDHQFATDVLNASLNFVAILFAVITFIAAEYKSSFSDESAAGPIYIALCGTTAVTFSSGVLAICALICLRWPRCNTVAPLAWAFGVIIIAAIFSIPYSVFLLIP
jgi:hypothetical protein